MRAVRYPNSPLLKDWAEKLVQLNNRELFKGAVVPSAILFVEDTITGAPKEAAPGRRPRKQTHTPKPQKNKKPFDIKVLHPALAERLDADYMVIHYKLRSVYMDVTKLRAYFLEVLMRIKPGGGLNPPDLKTFKVLAKAVGIDYEDRQFLGLDVLEKELIKGTSQQITVDDLARKRAEKAATEKAESTPEVGAPAVSDTAPVPEVGLALTVEIEPQTEVTATADGAAAETQAGGEPDYWTPPEPYVKPEQVKDANPPAAAGE